MSAHLMCMDIGTSGVAPPDFKTQAEIADIIKVPERTLEDWRLNHLGPPYMKLGHGPQRASVLRSARILSATRRFRTVRPRVRRIGRFRKRRLTDQRGVPATLRLQSSPAVSPSRALWSIQGRDLRRQHR